MAIRHLIWISAILTFYTGEAYARHKCPKVPSAPGFFGLILSPLSLPSGTFMAAARSMNTSGCDRGHPSSDFYRPSKAEVERFIHENHQLVMEESVRGRGPHLEALASMTGCSEGSVQFATELKRRHEELFLTPSTVDEDDSPDNPSAIIITDRIFELKSTSPKLISMCFSG